MRARVRVVWVRARRHTVVRTRTHARACTRTRNACVCAYFVRAHMHTVHTCTHMYIHIFMPAALTLARAHTLTHARAHARPRIVSTRARVLCVRYARARTHIHLSRARTHVHMRAHAHTQPAAHTQSHTHHHTRSRHTHTLTHTHERTQASTYARTAAMRIRVRSCAGLEPSRFVFAVISITGVSAVVCGWRQRYFGAIVCYFWRICLHIPSSAFIYRHIFYNYPLGLRARALRTAKGGGGLRRDLQWNAIGGTVPASLSALTNLYFLCATPPARTCSLWTGTHESGCAQQPFRAVCGGGARQRGAMGRALAATISCRLLLHDYYFKH
jgi:hypothetical protein